MHPAASSIVENARKNHHFLVPLLLVLFSAIAQVHSPVQHQLLVTSVSWALVCIPVLFRAGLWTIGEDKSRTSAWLAGGFLALAQICDRAACDREGIWSTKGLLPLFVVLVSENDLLSKYIALPTWAPPADSPTDNGPNSEQPSYSRSFRLLAVATISASLALATRFTSSPTSALGVCSVIFAATGLVILESASKATRDGGNSGRTGFVSANGTFSRRSSIGGAQNEQQLAVLRDVAVVIAAVCGVAAFLMEPSVAPDVMVWESRYTGNWKTLHHHRTIQQILLMICVGVVVNVSMFVMLSQQGAVHTSFLNLFSVLCARLRYSTSFSGSWFTILYGSSAFLFLLDSSLSSSFSDMRTSRRFRRIIFGAAVLSIGLVLFQHAARTRRAHEYYTIRKGASGFYAFPPNNPFKPVPIDPEKGHPAAQLIESAEQEFQQMLNKQSKTLGEAVQEYRRRNGIAPPPHFDKWYEFATRNEVVLIDEYDTIMQTLLPFWAIKPSTTRTRIKNALGYEDSALLGMTIRGGNVVNIEGGEDWQRNATVEMVKKFVQYLPDMDLAFNVHDEPRVLVPNDHLSAMVSKAQNEVLPSIINIETPRNSFSPRPSDMSDGKKFEESSTSRFNRFSHQQTWTQARLSCPARTQAQMFEDQVPDNLTAYAAGPLNHIYNHSAFSDICNSPSLSYTFGFFERPNAFSVVHELTPIFSQSKISSFQDILYPSPWYWFGKVQYDEKHDTTWENKTNSLYWRGSTTGGFSRNGGWRRQHRQRVVRRINAPEKASIFISENTSPNPAYVLQEVDRKLYRPLIDIKFTSIGQCDPGDCDAQKEFFELTERADGQDAWYYKHLLDMDGNAFSGRFYAFLKSRSLTYKMAIFREWHQEWLRPWVHYVPLTLIGDEHLDLVRWFAGGKSPETISKELDASGERGVKSVKGKKDGNGETLGERKAKEMAEKSRDWAGKVLRNVDFEAWFFRLLLEYGRVIDDDREKIGFAGP